MKILIVTSVAGAWPYIPEMLVELRSLGHQVEIFDIDELGRPPIPLRLALRSRHLAPSARIAALKQRLLRVARDFDVVNIHYVAPIYAKLAPVLKRRGSALVASIWGSDFLRAGPEALEALGRTFDSADIVTSNNPRVAEGIKAWRGRRDDVRVVRFGLGSFDQIDQLMSAESFRDIRASLDLPENRIILACGYNASRQQNHAMIAQGISMVSPQKKASLFALVPMSYPVDPGYVAEVRQAFEASGIDFRIVDTMQTMEMVCRTRIASDVAVNVQVTDSLSASIQEHMLAGSAMVVGDWLPYQVFEDLGVPLTFVHDAKDIARVLESSVPREPSRPPYFEPLYAFSSWRDNISRWLDIYASTGRLA